MKRILFVLSFLIPSYCWAQCENSISISELIGTVWKRTNTMTEREINMKEFSRREYVSTVCYGDTFRIHRLVRPYYISREIPFSFDESKIGNEEYGNYIVWYNTKINKMHVYRFISMQDDTLVLEAVPESGYIGGGDAVTLIYKRLK